MSEQSLITIGPKTFLPDKAEEYNYGLVSILYDYTQDSCKLSVLHDEFKKVIPVQGGVSPDALVIVVDTLAVALEAFGQKELANGNKKLGESYSSLAREILGAFTRFMISKPRVKDRRLQSWKS